MNRNKQRRRFHEWMPRCTKIDWNITHKWWKHKMKNNLAQQLKWRGEWGNVSYFIWNTMNKIYIKPWNSRVFIVLQSTVEPRFKVPRRQRFHRYNFPISTSRFHVIHFPFADFAYDEHLRNVNFIITPRFYPKWKTSSVERSNGRKLTANER